MKKIRLLFAAVLALTMLLAGCGADPGREVSLGLITDGVYENEYLDVRFAPEGWQLYGAEDLQESLKGVTSMLRGTELEKELEDLTQVMDMQAIAPNGTTNVNVVYTQMSAVEWAANQALSEEEAMDAVLDQREKLFESYEAVGIHPETMEKCTVTYCGEQRMGTKTAGTVQGIPCYILQIYERTLGPYSVVVTMTAFGEDTTAEIAEMFEKPIA